MLDKLQAFLDRINQGYGGIGSVIAVVFWIFILFWAIRHMLLDF